MQSTYGAVGVYKDGRLARTYKVGFVVFEPVGLQWTLMNRPPKSVRFYGSWEQKRARLI